MIIEKASLNDLHILQDLCKRCYTTVFADHWIEPGLELYLEQQFGTPQMQADLSDAHYEYYFIKYQNSPVGFLKLNLNSSNKFSSLDNCELEKIYILPKYSGLGLGRSTMNLIIDRVKQAGKKLLFLYVLGSNQGAITFYEKLGFELHHKAQLDLPYFKDHLRGMHCLWLKLD